MSTIPDNIDYSDDAEFVSILAEDSCQYTGQLGTEKSQPGNIVLGAYGTCDEAAAFSYEGVGGIVLSGEPNVEYTFIYNYISVGGIVVSGESDSSIGYNTYNYIASGGFTIGGDSVTAISSFSAIGSGGIILGGTVNIGNANFNGEASGGLTLFNSAVVRIGYPYAATSGITLDGENSLTAKYIFEFSGGLTISGDSEVIYGVAADVSGGVILGGDVDAAITKWIIATEGGITLGGNPAYTAKADFSFSASGEILISGKIGFPQEKINAKALSSTELRRNPKFIRIYDNKIPLNLTTEDDASYANKTFVAGKTVSHLMEIE